jgi:hypothetical protein
MSQTSNITPKGQKRSRKRSDLFDDGLIWLPLFAKWDFWDCLLMERSVSPRFLIEF